MVQQTERLNEKMDVEATSKGGYHQRWNHRTKLEKGLIGALILLAILAVVLIILTAHYAKDSRKRTHDSHVTEFTPCNTRNCVAKAHQMIEMMNPEAQPCQDFHDYACGGWVKKNTAEGKTAMAFAHQQGELVDSHLKTLLEKESTDTEAAAFKKVRDFYSSCMSMTVIKERGFRPAKDLLDTIGMISDKEMPRDSGNLTELVYKLFLKNGAPFFIVGASPSINDGWQKAITIGLPPWSKSLQLYKQVDFEILQRTINGQSDSDEEMVDIKSTNRKVSARQATNTTMDYNKLKAILDDQKDEKTYEILRNYFNRPATDVQQKAIEDEFSTFINDFRKIIPSAKELSIAEKQDRASMSLTIGYLQKMLYQIDWKFLLEKLFNRKFRDREVVEVMYPPYLEALQKLFSQYEERIIKNAALTLFARDVLWKLVNISKDEEAERWKFCVETTKELFPVVLSAIYLRDFDMDVEKSTQKQVQEMYSYFTRTFVRRIEENDWLDQESKDGARQKVESMKEFFAEYKYSNNETVIEESVKNVHIDEQKFFENVMNRHTESQLESYDMNKLNIDDATIELAVANPYVMNAFHIPNFNMLVMTLAFLKPMYDNPDQFKYLTFSSLGSTVGHEITHGLGVVGIKHNPTGQRKPWLTMPSEKQFQAKTQCLSKMYTDTFSRTGQYSGVDVDIKFDGNFTLDENLADVTGIILAYQAYQLWAEEHGQEIPLPGLRLSRDQLFFLSAAQAECSMASTIEYILYLESDPHTPGPERLNGFMMNSKGFAEAYHCPVGSPMNPAVKCKIW